MMRPEATSAEIRDAVLDVLESERYRSGAKRMAAIIADYAREDRALAELESLVGEEATPPRLLNPGP